MKQELSPIDVSAIPELARLARDTAREGRSVVLRVDDTDLAVLSPLPHRRRLDTPKLSLPRYPQGGIVAATAGAVRYDGPVLTAEEEREAFERGVAAEVEESLGG